MTFAPRPNRRPPLVATIPVAVAWPLLSGFVLGVLAHSLLGRPASTDTGAVALAESQTSPVSVTPPAVPRKGQRLPRGAYGVAIFGIVLTVVLAAIAYGKRSPEDGPEWFVHVGVFVLDSAAVFIGAAEAAYQAGSSTKWIRPTETTDVVVVVTFIIGFSAALYHFLSLILSSQGYHPHH